ncbi:mRNA interferase [Bacteroidia bacterium]|nr:mRNA interferase [Bacteroidia bacterium]
MHNIIRNITHGITHDIVRGDVFYADLSPVRGSEQGAFRPVVVIQNDVGNKASPTIIIAAVTLQTKNRLPTHVYLRNVGFLRDGSVVLLEQIRTVDKERLGNYLGRLEADWLRKIDGALALSVGLVEIGAKGV